MLDTAESDRPESRFALIAQEISRLNVDIAALGEVRFLQEGKRQVHGTEYTLYCSGKSTTKRKFQA